MNRLMQATVVAILLATLMPLTTHAQQQFNWVQDNIDTYNLEVVRVDGRRLTTRVFELEGRRTFRVPSNFKFYIDGVPTDVTQLQPRQRLTAYVTRASSGELILVDAGPVTPTPPVRPVAPVVVAQQAPAPEPMTMLPKTASVMPLTGIAGLLMLSVAFGVRRLRRRG